MSKEICQISIIVPFYNVELYFRQFLDSLLPLGKNCEIILVDDGSRDLSLIIATEFVERFDNVKLLIKENGGLSSARNYGFQFAKGDYVIFFDSDDYIEDKTVIIKMFEEGIKNNSDIVVAPYYEFIYLDKKKLRLDRSNFHLDLISLEDKMDKLLENDISFAVWNKMFKVDFLKENDLKFKEGIWFEDLDFIFKAFFYSNKISKIDDILIGYRQREGSIMKTISTKILDKIYVLDDLYIFLKNNKQLDLFYEKFKILYIRMVFSVLHSVITNKGEKKIKQNIFNEIFSFNFFNKIFKEDMLFKNKLSKSEKVLFYLIKNKILNKRNIIYTSYFNQFRKF
ncbi:glycosyltransferase family 2 protein [Flavobacterium sp. MR2016-29]|uniref:glycosyltransferase family 2 protein n=1 Tax=Flavobacterium sp. MR2016-29 TaxID=2783795 RepID=UPI00188A3044|nr:glycosyltransferase family 2 protein [Flavobacterium sp. MR2016-29]MBF4492901.1 glycosyltransferase family 2 protein [Flavobacterium sp. MR2016-29]